MQEDNLARVLRGLENLITETGKIQAQLQTLVNYVTFAQEMAAKDAGKADSLKSEDANSAEKEQE